MFLFLFLIRKNKMRQHEGKDITFQACKAALETLKRLTLQGELASLVFPKSFRMIQKNGCYWKRKCLMPQIWFILEISGCLLEFSFTVFLNTLIT